MASTQDLRKRIKSVKNTQQITKAMKMVSSARLAKAQQKALSTTPYAQALHHMLEHLFSGVMRCNDPLAQRRDGKRVAYVVIGADKGLAGAFNSNVLKKTLPLVQGKDPKDVVFITSGRKPADMLRHKGYTLAETFQGYSDRPALHHAQAVAQAAKYLFVSGEVDEVHLIYTHFINSLTAEVRVSQLLPVIPTKKDDAKKGGSAEAAKEHENKGERPLEALYDFLPSQEAVLSALLPKAIDFTVYSAMLQSAASELGARMTAMTTASDNAGALIDTLNLEYNRMRQAQITNEISEIIGGANALA